MSETTAPIGFPIAYALMARITSYLRRHDINGDEFMQRACTELLARYDARPADTPGADLFEPFTQHGPRQFAPRIQRATRARLRGLATEHERSLRDIYWSAVKLLLDESEPSLPAQDGSPRVDASTEAQPSLPPTTGVAVQGGVRIPRVTTHASIQEACARLLHSARDPAWSFSLPWGGEESEHAGLGALRLGDLVTLGAPVGQGKTTLALQIMIAMARQGHGALWVSLEAGIEDVTSRMARQSVAAPTPDTPGGTTVHLSPDHEGMDAALSTLGRLPIDIEAGVEELEELTSLITRRAAMGGLECVFIDSVDAIVAPGLGMSDGVWRRRVPRRLARLARDLGVVVVVTSTLGDKEGQGSITGSLLDVFSDLVMSLRADPTHQGCFSLRVERDRSRHHVEAPRVDVCHHGALLKYSLGTRAGSPFSMADFSY